MKRLLLALYGILLLNLTFGQCPTAGFLIQSPVCAGLPVTITNNTVNGAFYEWNFCPYTDFDSSTVVPYANLHSLMGGIFGVVLVKDSLNYYGFAQNGSNELVRLDFGDDMDNMPTVTSLGVLVGGLNRSNVTFVRVGYNWHAFYCGYSGGLSRIDFGTSLTNIPTATTVSGATINGGVYSLDCAVDNGNVILYISSFDNNNVSIVDFGPSITNLSPVTTIIASSHFPGATGIIDVDIVKDCATWYALATSDNGHVYKLELGASLVNPSPAFADVATVASNNKRGYITRNGNAWYYFFYSPALGVNILNFGTSLANNTPVLLPNPSVSLSGFGNSEAQDYIVCNGNIYGISIPYSTTDLQKFKYLRDCQASLPVSTDFEPAGLSFMQGGSYPVQLTAYDSSGNSGFSSSTLVVNAAPSAGFSVSNTCVNQSTVFTDQSTISGGSVTAWKWYFGDSDSSQVQNPGHPYADQGNYLVTLIATASSGCSDSVSLPVAVSSTPVAHFQSVTGCSDQPLQFTDSSTIAFGSVTGWLWDFGDASGTSLNEDPLYAYPDGGLFTVTLIASSDSGCSDTATATVPIRSSPDGAFLATNTCVGQPVQFQNQTTSDTTVVSYDWDFGDATGDNVQNPSHTYPLVVATYPVSLVVLAANGCSDTVSQSIKINNIPAVNFTFTPTGACEGNAVTFTDSSTVSGDSISKWLWTFGDGFFDTTQNPVHTYGGFGTYNVSLIAYAPTLCGSSTSQPITVIESPRAGFLYTPVCLGNAMVFTDTTHIPSGSSLVSYHWDFGDGDSSDVPNPVHEFTTAGTHTVVLTVESNFGCTDSVSVLVTVHPPPIASFTFSNPCSDYPVQFNSTSSAPLPYLISAYRWNFGDAGSGTNDTSSLAAPAHTFDTTLSYAVTLIVTTNAGCADTTFSVLNIKQSSVANFQYSPTCQGGYTDFTNLSTPPSLDTAWYWRFGDGQYSILREPAHYYVNHGSYQVRLTVTASNGCVSEAIKTVTVSPIPVADFIVSPACIGTAYPIQDNSSIASGSTLVSWKWVVQGLDSSTAQQPSFVFPDTGNYAVKLTVTSSDNCTHSVTKTVRVYPLPVANFVFNPQYGNPPLPVNFTNMTTGGSSYQWNFGDGNQSTATNPSNVYQDTGKFTIRLIAQSTEGCLDTASKSIYVIQPLLDLAVESISSYVLNNHLYMSAIVKNLGTRDVTSFDISADIDNGNTIQETFTGLLPNGSVGSTLMYDFNASYELTQGQDVRYFCIRVSRPNGETDAVAGNDAKCNSLVSGFSIMPSYPNPFVTDLTIEIVVPYSDDLTVELFDHSGKKVEELFNGLAAKGLNSIHADLQHLSSGIYALKCTFRDEVLMQSILKSNIPK